MLLIDLCARLPYGVIIEITSDGGMVEASYDMRLDAGLLADLLHSEDDFKPYLRPMSSLTEEETLEFVKTTIKTPDGYPMWATDSYDWLNAHHFDYRGLIVKRLAIEAPEDMYKTE